MSNSQEMDLEFAEWEYTLVHETHVDVGPAWYTDYDGIRLRAHSKAALLHRLAEAIAVAEGEHEAASRGEMDGGE